MPTRFDEIRTPRLLLRRWRESDRAPFADLNADPEVMRYLPAVLDRAASDALVERLEQRFEDQGFGLWALELRSTGAFLGFTGLNPMPADVPGAGGYEVGWRLARHAWHQGYATEAARAVVRFGFEELGVHRLWAHCVADNVGSARVLEKLGMRREGHLRENEWYKGRWWDTLLYAILEDEWRALASATPEAPGSSITRS